MVYDLYRIFVCWKTSNRFFLRTFFRNLGIPVRQKCTQILLITWNTFLQKPDFNFIRNHVLQILRIISQWQNHIGVLKILKSHRKTHQHFCQIKNYNFWRGAPRCNLLPISAPRDKMSENPACWTQDLLLFYYTIQRLLSWLFMDWILQKFVPRFFQELLLRFHQKFKDSFKSIFF